MYIILFTTMVLAISNSAFRDHENGAERLNTSCAYRSVIFAPLPTKYC